MTVTSARTTNVTPSIDEEAELGFGALLIAESEDGGYEPIGLVSTLREAREIAALNFASRMEELEKGGDPVCPARYVIWRRGFNGAYRIVLIIEQS